MGGGTGPHGDGLNTGPCPAGAKLEQLPTGNVVVTESAELTHLSSHLKIGLYARVRNC